MKTVFMLSFALFLVVDTYSPLNRKVKVRPVNLNDANKLEKITREVKAVLPEVGYKNDPKNYNWTYQLIKVLEANDLVGEQHFYIF